MTRGESPTAVALGDDWVRLPPIVQRLHEPCTAVGSFRIERGTGSIVTVLCWLSGLPRAGTDVPTRVEVRQGPDAFTWARRFGDDVLVTRQRAIARGTIAERFGMIECSFRPEASGQGLDYQQTGASVCVGSLRLPLPIALWPRVEGRTRGLGDTMDVEVVVSAPLVGRLLRYHGAVRPEPIG
jgi:hypothetical protein